MKRTRALVIVDMQPIFIAAEPIIPKVIKAIKYAKKDNDRIIVVEFDRTSATYPEIMKVLKGYEKHSVVTKSDVDGSRQVMSILPRKQEFVLNVCGVNLNACVYYTVKGLLKHKAVKSVNLLLPACNDLFEGRDLGKYPKHKKLKIQREL